jgi:hypothetical protein
MSEPEVRQEPDRLERRSIVTVAVASLVLGAIALVVSELLLERWGEEPKHPPPLAAPRTIGTLEQTLITNTQRGVDQRREQQATLRRWEWADRDAGVARIPINDAIELLAAKPPPPDRPLEPEEKEAEP